MLIEIYEQYLKEMERRLIQNPELYPRRTEDGPRYFGELSYASIIDRLLIISQAKERYKENNEWKHMHFEQVVFLRYAAKTSTHIKEFCDKLNWYYEPL